MHELSLAQNIFEIVEEAVKANNASSVAQLVLDIGSLSGVEIYALETAIDSLKPGTILEKAELIINIIQAKVICLNCNQQFSPTDIVSPCPKCTDFNIKIIEGKELKIRSITAE
jgi:hydrogenase nickel incorporation protein HypA/HybF